MLSTIATLILVVFLGGWLINYLLIQTSISRYFRWVVRPGIIIHELSHCIGCLITLTPIKKVSFFAPNGGFVKHERPKIPVLGDIIISFAPIVGGFLAIYFFSNQLLPSREALTITNLSDLSLSSFLSLPFTSWHFWLFTYLLIAISATLAPSEQDIKNSFSAIVLIGLAIYFLQSSAVAEKTNQLIISIYNHIIPPILLAIVISGLIFIIDLILIKRKFF